MMSISESNDTPENTAIAAESKHDESDYSAPVRVLRWLVIHFFKTVEGIIKLFGAIYYGVKTIAVLLFRYFIWPYPIYFRWFRRHK